MTKVTKQTTINRPIGDVFDYLADFTNTAEWDPGIVESTRIDEGPLRVGSKFALVSEFKGRRIPLVYEMEVFDAPTRAVLRGEGKAFTGVDDIRLSSIEEGSTVVEWNADFQMKGIGKLAEPFLKGTFEKIATEALAGLQQRLG